MWAGIFVLGIVNMIRGRRLAMTTEEENFQVWLEKNWDRPLSDEVERLQGELKRSETVLAADLCRLRKAESEWWGLLRIGFLVCLGLVALLLWHINNYLETKGALKEVCALVAGKVSTAKMPERDLKEIISVCDERATL